ncbi:MAG: HlyD family efflux transporter periplasmic adaptor subunit [Oscillospiraceae bacterium]
MNSVLSKVIASLLSLMLLAYVGFQSFVSLYNPYQSEIVNKGTYVSDVDLNGFFVRDEAVIGVKKEGVTSYSYKNGQKISKGATVASVYENEKDLYNLRNIEALKSQKLILEEAQNKKTIKGLKLDLLNSQISASKAELRKQVDENKFTNIDSVSNDLMLNINKIAVCVDNSVNYDQTIASLDSQITALKAQVPDQSGVITSETSGYFSNTADGYEDIFTLDMLDNLTIDSVKDYQGKQAKLAKKESNSIGKIVYENYWYFVSTVPVKDAEVLSKPYNIKQTIKLKFNSKSTREIDATIEDIITKKGSDTAVVIFKSFYLDEDLINMRFETPKAVINSYSGVIIPKEAIRIQDGVKDEETGEVLNKVKGVYTLLGKTVRFKKVNPIYEDDYILISQQTDKSDYVSVYDQVILKGKNMNADS